MGIEELKFDLHEMQLYLEDKIQNVRTICDLELSENDYRRLGIKLKSLFAFATNSNFAENFMLCIAVYWTYDFIYWDEKYAKFDSELVQMYRELSQYSQRYRLMMFRECFHDFGLNGYQVQSDNLMQDCCRMVARHAGIPVDEAPVVFELVERYLMEDNDVVLHTIQPFLPKKMSRICSYMDESMKLEVIEELRQLIMAADDTDADYDAMSGQFPHTSDLLIRQVISWQKSRNLRKCSI